MTGEEVEAGPSHLVTGGIAVAVYASGFRCDVAELAYKRAHHAVRVLFRSITEVKVVIRDGGGRIPRQVVDDRRAWVFSSVWEFSSEA